MKKVSKLTKAEAAAVLTAESLDFKESDNLKTLRKLVSENIGDSVDLENYKKAETTSKEVETATDVLMYQKGTKAPKQRAKMITEIPSTPQGSLILTGWSTIEGLNAKGQPKANEGCIWATFEIAGISIGDFGKNIELAYDDYVKSLDSGSVPVSFFEGETEEEVSKGVINPSLSFMVKDSELICLG